MLQYPFFDAVSLTAATAVPQVPVNPTAPPVIIPPVPQDKLTAFLDLCEKNQIVYKYGNLYMYYPYVYIMEGMPDQAPKQDTSSVVSSTTGQGYQMQVQTIEEPVAVTPKGNQKEEEEED
jgi:hypothetical protein